MSIILFMQTDSEKIYAFFNYTVARKRTVVIDWPMMQEDAWNHLKPTHRHVTKPAVFRGGSTAAARCDVITKCQCQAYNLLLPTTARLPRSLSSWLQSYHWPEIGTTSIAIDNIWIALQENNSSELFMTS